MMGSRDTGAPLLLVPSLLYSLPLSTASADKWMDGTRDGYVNN